MIDSFGSLSAIKNTIANDNETWQSTAVETEGMDDISDYTAFQDRGSRLRNFGVSFGLVTFFGLLIVI